jgi:hypothetical protein
MVIVGLLQYMAISNLFSVMSKGLFKFREQGIIRKYRGFICFVIFFWYKLLNKFTILTDAGVLLFEIH